MFDGHDSGERCGNWYSWQYSKYLDISPHTPPPPPPYRSNVFTGTHTLDTGIILQLKNKSDSAIPTLPWLGIKNNMAAEYAQSYTFGNSVGLSKYWNISLWREEMGHNPPGGREGGWLPYEQVADARRELLCWPLRGTKKGVVQAFFYP